MIWGSAALSWPYTLFTHQGLFLFLANSDICRVLLCLLRTQTRAHSHSAPACLPGHPQLALVQPRGCISGIHCLRRVNQHSPVYESGVSAGLLGSVHVATCVRTSCFCDQTVLLHRCLGMDNAMMNAREQDTSWVTKITLLNLGDPNAIPMAAQFCIPMRTPSYSLPHFLDYSSTCTVMILGLSSLDKFCVESLQWQY